MRDARCKMFGFRYVEERLKCFILHRASCIAHPFPVSFSPRPFNFGQFVSRPFNFVYVLLSILLLLCAPAPAGWREFVGRVAWIVLAFVGDLVVVQGAKHIFYAPRPNSGNSWKWGRHPHSGFPSGHTVPAWMLATMGAHVHAAWAPLWFALAALIAWARWKVRAHFAYQVAGSALLGLMLGALAVWEGGLFVG